MYLVLIIIAIAFLGGCVFHHDLPVDWRLVAGADECPNLQGYYEDRGENHEGLRYAVTTSLYMELLDGKLLYRDEVEFVKITQLDKELVLEAYIAGSIEATRVLNYAKSDCERGLMALEIPDTREHYREGDTSINTWYHYRLARAENGGLIVERTDMSVGHFSIIPMGLSQRKWFRFRELKP